MNRTIRVIVFASIMLAAVSIAAAQWGGGGGGGGLGGGGGGIGGGGGGMGGGGGRSTPAPGGRDAPGTPPNIPGPTKPSVPPRGSRPAGSPVFPMDPHDAVKMPSNPEVGGAVITTQIANSPATPESKQLSAALASAGHRAFAAKCGAAVDRVMKLRADYKLTIPPETLTRQEQKDVLSALEEYDAACLRTPSAGNGLDDNARRLLAASVGVLVSSDQRVYCTATRVAPDLLVTARHCVFAESTSQAVAKPLIEIHFRVAGRPSIPVPIVEAIHPTWAKNNGTLGRWTANEDLHDYVLLRTPIDTTAPRIRLAEPREFDRLLMFGYQANAALIATLRQLLGLPIPMGTASASMNWPSALRFDNAATCSIGKVKKLGDGVCLLHGCQTEGSTSGAPLFRIEGGELVLVGIHTRSFGTSDAGQCAVAELTALGNVGLRIGSDATAIILAATPLGPR